MFGWFSDEASRASRLKRRIASAFLRERRLQELDRDRPRQPRVLRLVDDAHAAAAQRCG